MNYRDFNLGDWIGHISGVIEDETTLDGNEMRDLVEFLSTLKQEPCEDTISRQAALEKVRAMQTYKLFVGDDMILVDKAEVQTELMMLPTAQPERKKMSNKECVDFLSEQFDISRTSAKEMLHTMMSVKREDNFKKQFSGRK